MSSQGDVTAVLNSSGNVLVSYAYDAWGNIISTTYSNGGASTAAAYNPFRYRGYYYDSETSFYYLNSRYYDPEIGRFINADSIIAGANGNIRGYNLFAYCMNNAVNLSDPDGQWPKFVDKAKDWIFDKIDKVKDWAYSVYYNATAWHFEEREALNGEHPTYEEVKCEESGWALLKPEESILHDNGIGNPEEKYIKPDGREAVFDGDTLEPMTDPEYIATYNYVSLYIIPDEGATIIDYVKYGYTWIGHGVVDVIPYYLTGKSNTREQFEEKIFIFD